MDDLISRQAAFEALCNATFGCADIGVCKKGDRYCAEGAKLDEVPSAQPERKNGRWYRIGNTGLATCECGFVTERYSIYKYCPNCGSYNGGGDDE